MAFWFFSFGAGTRTVAAELASFADRLATLAAKCDELGLKEQAEITRGWIIPRHPGRQYLFLPTASDPAAPKPAAPTAVRQWYDEFLHLRRQQAAALFAAAKAASGQQQAARAYQLLHEVLREDPDHAEARRILGYVNTARGGWTLPDWEKSTAPQARLDHPTLGWRARSYWRAETPHFQIVTDHSARAALELGGQLEDLHALWRQIFFRFWSAPEALAARFAGHSEPLTRDRPKMQVVLFKNREEYAQKLAPLQPQIGLTLGLYLDQQRTAYFFAGDASVYPTWYHEATHQLFQEAVPGTVDHPGEQRNFWAIEAAALYMESLQKRGHSTFYDGDWTSGGCEAERLQLARYRALSGDFFMPLDRLTTLGREELQKSDDLRRLYGQSAGLAHFLIDGEGGTYREALIDLLTAVYRGEDAADTLVKTTGQSFKALEQQYQAFLNVSDDDLAGIPEPGRLRNLSLGRTSVTDQGLACLAGCKNLQWLDLSLTAVNDDGLAHIAAASGLKQLFLEGTKVTDASLPFITGFKQLEALDLSKLPITDNGLASIAGLRTLKELYLNGSPISDAGLVHLRGLKQLEKLETDGTQITPEGLKRLRAVLPKLKPSPGPSPQP